MTRKEFIRISTFFGLGLPLQSTVASCGKDEITTTPFLGKVIIVGAGAGGLSAGYFLERMGIDFEILEASANYGGRMRTNTEFADFPIPLGAEWLHTSPDVFQQIVADDSITVDIQTQGYDNLKDTVGFWDGSNLKVDQLVDSDRKFIGSTWFDFFDTHIVPKIKDRIIFNAIVKSVDYSEEQIRITTQQRDYVANKVILALPLKILQLGLVNFVPPFPEQKKDDIGKARIWDGFKAFFEFSQKFYHTATAFDITPETDGQKLFYDASYGQQSEKSILGLFAVGQPAQPYLSRKEDDLRDFILRELDEIYGGAATPNFLKHLTQNWNEEPFIRGGYLADHENWRLVRRLSEPIGAKLFFAGAAFTDGEDWVAVENAAVSGRRAAMAITK